MSSHIVVIIGSSGKESFNRCASIVTMLRRDRKRRKVIMPKSGVMVGRLTRIIPFTGRNNLLFVELWNKGHQEANDINSLHGAGGGGKFFLCSISAAVQLKILTNDVLGEELFSYHNGNMPLESMSYVAQMRPTRRSLA